MSLALTAPEVFEAALAPFERDAVPDGEAYQRLCGMAIDHPIAARLAGLDPFSEAYRRGAMALYHGLSGRSDGYEPARDEQSHTAVPPNIWTDLPPWSFRQPAMVAEFLLSWARILRLLDLPAGGTVLEYGSGTGQLLTVLARSGLRAFGVDIDAASIDLSRRQAEALGLAVELEQAPFGEGFEGRRFDRIVFFESFHHAWDFERILQRLHDRLAPGGRVVFCGEPIVQGAFPAIPFAWGPRLDALSVLCMRRWGWMELGFQHDFFVRALRRNGWSVAFHQAPDCGRANAYVAEPAPASLLRLGDAGSLDVSAHGWGPPEGTHRWTEGGGASVLPLPPSWSGDEQARVSVRVSNPTPVAKRLVVSAGERSGAVFLAPGEDGAVELASGRATRLVLVCETPDPAGAGSNGPGGRGLAVREVELQGGTPPLPPLAAAAAPEAGPLPFLKEIGRPFWRRLPPGVRARLRERLPL